MFCRVTCVLFALVPLFAESAVMAGIMFDFSSNPGLQTDNSANYFIEDGKFKANSLTNSQEYGTFTTDYAGGSFVMEFDIRVTERTTGDTNVGFFSASRNSNQPSPGDPAIYVIYGGFEQGVGLRGYDANGVAFDTGALTGPFALDTDYHNKLTYNATSKEATLLIPDLSFNETVAIPNGLLTPLPHLGVSSTGSWANTGRQQRVEIDNLSVDNASIVPEASTAAISSVVLGMWFAGSVCRRRRKRPSHEQR